MQAVFPSPFYDADMAKTASRLRALREAAGLSQRELARVLELDSSIISFWEKTGKIPRSEVLLPIAKALGVTVEDLLGETENKRTRPVAGGKLGQIFERASKLPRRQQQKIVELIEPFVDRHQPKITGKRSKD
jgi:transcriptional regulator with XRE-family HTH domain